LGFLIDNIFVIFQQTVGIPRGTNCAPLLADLFLYSYEAEFIQKPLHVKNKPLVIAFNSTFRNINDVLPINSNRFHSYIDSIYPRELEIKDTIEPSTSASYLDVLLNIDAGGKLTTRLYDKRITCDESLCKYTYVLRVNNSQPIESNTFSQLHEGLHAEYIYVFLKP
jgi:hypothetical protein